MLLSAVLQHGAISRYTADIIASVVVLMIDVLMHGRACMPLPTQLVGWLEVMDRDRSDHQSADNSSSSSNRFMAAKPRDDNGHEAEKSKETIYSHAEVGSSEVN